MTVLVDTPVWSLALRRKPRDLSSEDQRTTRALAELIQEGRARLIGAVRQELLSGIREDERFNRLRQYLRAFDNPQIETEDFEEAASMSNRCRTRGIAGSEIDFLICAMAYHRRWQIFTTDRDFARYAKILPINLYSR